MEFSQNKIEHRKQPVGKNSLKTLPWSYSFQVGSFLRLPNVYLHQDGL